MRFLRVPVAKRLEERIRHAGADKTGRRDGIAGMNQCSGITG